MKATCLHCKKDYDETDWMQFTRNMTPTELELYWAYEWCPVCYMEERG